jgi:hypothetical protein
MDNESPDQHPSTVRGRRLLMLLHEYEQIQEVLSLTQTTNGAPTISVDCLQPCSLQLLNELTDALPKLWVQVNRVQQDLGLPVDSTYAETVAELQHPITHHDSGEPLRRRRSCCW